jgi:hypothetical protein
LVAAENDKLFQVFGQQNALVPLMPSLLVALGPEGPQHTLPPLLIGRPEPLEITGRKSPA